MTSREVQRAADRVRDGGTPLLTDTATCPYCAETITLGACSIVATETVNYGSSAEPRSSLFEGLDAEADSTTGEAPSDPPTQTPGSATKRRAGTDQSKDGRSGSRPISGASVYDWAGPGDRWPVIGLPPLAKYNDLPVGRWQRLKSLAALVGLKTRSPPLLENVDASCAIEDLPARLCPGCATPLPLDIDTRELLTIAVVGIRGAGKTNYLATMLRTATHHQALYDSLGCTEFAPDEATALRFHQDYYLALFAGDGTLFERTKEEELVRFLPLAFRATFRDGVKRTLLFHDVSGEVFSDRARRNRFAPFVRRADGIIFLIDPQWMPTVRSLLRQEFGIELPLSRDNQADLLNAVADEISRARRLAEVPFALAVSKSDLVARAIGGTPLFLRAPPCERDAWMTDMNAVGDEVEGLLYGKLEARDVLVAARRIGNITFHAVSPLGTQPIEGKLVPEHIRPSRVLDPLVSVLNRISKADI